ncbi:DUF4191 domain-containing protein [Nakamurella leprariae]|uniref:DUF4191 domain-containing protein n=1 Tax=Nakamurella leprariae TaxID=2803911 RepID=A0A939C186_9ACTN|nr:DUF4191 domain-containing protein [Nakamurella leprariae]MBM9469541.1 DUF4191 domain-containing protein [Nakamurella leprariae]
MAKSSTTAGKPDKAEAKAAEKAAKAARKASSKERRGQIWQAFKMQRKEDNKLLPLMIGALLLCAVVITGLGWLVGLPWWAALPFGIIIGALVAMIIFSRRVQANVYKKAEGQPGAAGWMLQNNLRGRWRITPGVAGTTQLDVVHRVIGRPGVILVGEGAPHRVKPLIAQEKKRIARVVGETPIYDFVVGNDEGQIPLSKLNARLIKLPRNIAANSVTELDNRLTALTARAPQAGLPKGPLPAGAKMRNMQRAARRR